MGNTKSKLDKNTRSKKTAQAREIVSLPKSLLANFRTKLGDENFSTELKSPRIGTLSFPVYLDGKKPNQQGGALYDNTDLIIEVIKERQPDVLLCAGWTIPAARLSDIKDATKGIKTVVLLEADGINYRIGNGTCDNMEEQFFSIGAGVNDENVSKLEAAIQKRSFDIFGRHAFLLVCGEIMAVRNKTNLRDVISKSSSLKKAICDKNTIIFNPTHTRMGRMKDKRIFLSESGSNRIYVSASNSIRESDTLQRQNCTETTHSLWCDGKPQAYIAQALAEAVCYREWYAS